MRNQKLLLVGLLVALSLSAALPPTVKAGPVQGTFYLTGKVKLDKLGLQDAKPRITVRLYPPKQANRPVLIAYGDGNGNFQFTDITEGAYLLEAYAENQMIYQKAIQISAAPGPILDDKYLFLDDQTAMNRGEELVQPFVKLKERNQTALAGFQGSLSVSIGNINRITKKVTIKITETNGNQLAKEDKKIGNNIYVEFKYNGTVYYLKGYTMTGFTSYLYFQIFRKTN
jgi:hypothetical protein